MTALDDAIDRPSITWAEPRLLVPARVMDDFSTTVSDSWGQAPTGGQWVNYPGDAASDYNVTSAGATHRVAAVNTFRISSILPRSIRERYLVNPDIVVNWSTSAAAAAAGVLEPANVVFRRPGGNGSTTYMILRMEVGPAGVFTGSIRQFVSGVETNLSGTQTFAGITYATGARYATRVRVAGNTVRTRTWLATPGCNADNDPAEPTTWHLSYTGTMLRASGLFGVRSGVSVSYSGGTPVTYVYDYFAARDWPVRDMSDYLGSGFTVKQALDDGLPDPVTSTSSGEAAGALTFPLLGDDRTGMTPAQTWSPLNPAGVAYDLDVDIAPLTLDFGAVTEQGPEYERIFTGQMTDLQVAGGAATVRAVSETRIALMRAVQPPAVAGVTDGATGTWLVQWVLNACGIYVAPPPPTSGCKWWAPMNGGLKSQIPGANSREGINFQRPASETYPTWREGPFPNTLAPAADDTHIIDMGALALDGAWGGLLTATTGRGRLEFWIHGSTITHGADSFVWTLDDDDSTAQVKVDIGATRIIRLTINDGGGSVSFSYGAAIPQDGQWHFVGVFWDMAGNYVEINLDGDVDATSPGMNAFDLPSAETLTMSLISYYPVAQIMLLAGTYADPTVTPWALERADGWEAQAIVRPSLLTLEAIAEPVAREAWAILSDLARGEFAALRIDEDDLFGYLPLTWFGEADQQVSAGTISTSVAAGELDLVNDPTKVRNRITIEFNETRVDRTQNSTLLAYSTAITLRNGVQTITFALDNTTTRLFQNGVFQNLNSTQVAAGTWSSAANHITANTSSDGTGSYLTSAQVLAEVSAWNAGSVEMRFTNFTGTTAYLVNNGTGVPFLHVCGRAVTIADGYVTVTDDESVAIRGERTLTSRLAAVQNRQDATTMATLLAAMLSTPTAVATVPALGNPARRPGQLVTVLDAEQTQASGEWRVLSVEHTLSGARYAQRMLIKKQSDAAVWDASVWGGSVWAP